MKVSVAWIAVGIIIGIILFFTVEGFSIYEQFTNQVEGFADVDEYADSTDIKITSCPADTASYIDGGGRTVCCEGTVINGKCSGKNICSLSEPIAGLPTCSAWLDAYLENNKNYLVGIVYSGKTCNELAEDRYKESLNKQYAHQFNMMRSKD